jgi:hypothetical protein
LVPRVREGSEAQACDSRFLGQHTSEMHRRIIYFDRSFVMSKQWEYDIQSLPTAGQPGQQQLAVMNQLGKDGWELAHIVGQSYIFKREKVDGTDKKPRRGLTVTNQ